tara:strand:+ start:3161 stop:4171 length:1011 start_codon:yes stop_codon:yes gene_type:complete
LGRRFVIEGGEDGGELFVDDDESGLEFFLPVGLEEEVVAGVAAFDLAGAGSAKVFAGGEDGVRGDAASEERTGGTATTEDGDDEGLGRRDAAVGGEDAEEGLFGGVVAFDTFDFEGDFQGDGGAEDVVEADVVTDFSDLIGLDDAFGNRDLRLGYFERFFELLEGGFIGCFVGAFDENPDGGFAFDEIVFDALPEGGIEDVFEGGLGSLEDEGFGVLPALWGVKEKGGDFGDFFEADDGEFLVGREFFEVEDFEFQIEMVGDPGEFGRGFAGGDELESKGISLPSFEGVAEDGDLAGEGLNGENEEEEELHCWGAKVWMWPRSVETMRRPWAEVSP